jgi:RNA recognition motif-containing protein
LNIVRGASSEPPSDCLWLGNVPESATEADIRREFARFGMIERIKVSVGVAAAFLFLMREGLQLLQHKSCCFVNFSELDCAVQAHNAMQGLQIHGQTIRVGFGKVRRAESFPGVSSHFSRLIKLVETDETMETTLLHALICGSATFQTA